MKPAEYRKLTRQRAIGRRVRILQTLNNDYGTFPAGTTATITDKYAGFSLKSDPCSHCGATVKMSMVPSVYLDLLPEERPQL